MARVISRGGSRPERVDAGGSQPVSSNCLRAVRPARCARHGRCGRPVAARSRAACGGAAPPRALAGDWPTRCGGSRGAFVKRLIDACEQRQKGADRVSLACIDGSASGDCIANWLDHRIFQIHPSARAVPADNSCVGNGCTGKTPTITRRKIGLMEPDAQLAPRVLLAVSDALLRRVASAALRSRGFSVSATTEGPAALTLATSFSPDVVMVDLQLPSPHGGSLFRQRCASFGLVWLVGIAPPDATTCVSVPCGGCRRRCFAPVPRRVGPRCQALLRRPSSCTAVGIRSMLRLTLRPLTATSRRKEIRVRNHDIPVTRIEFALFEKLCRRPSEVCHAPTARRVWGPNWVGDTHVVDVHLSNLRRKLQLRAPSCASSHRLRVSDSG